MIENLQNLPPIPEEDSPLKKIIRPLIGVLVLAAMAAGILWFFTSGLKHVAQEEMSVSAGLRGVAADLWRTGAAPEVRLPDPALAAELTRLRAAAAGSPTIIVIEAENRAGQAAASHEILYLHGTKQLLSVRVLLDRDEGKVDILSFRTDPGFPNAPAEP